MNMRKIQYILSGITLITLPLGIHAQQQAKDSTVNRTVVVEQEYTPDIPDASKINVLPQVEAPTANKKAVEYDVTLVPANTIPATVMQAYTGKETQAETHPGYIRLGYGNYGNLDARAGYLFTLSGRDRLNLNFRMNGMDGKLDLPDNDGKFLLLSHSCQYGLCAPLQESRPERCGQLRIEQLQFPARCSRQKTEVHFR